MLAKNKRIFNLYVKRLYINMQVYIHTHVHLCLSIHIYISSVAQSCPTLCNPTDCSTPGFPVHQQLLELAQTHVHELVMPSNHLILCRPLLLLPSIFPSIRVFSSESVLHIRWPKDWNFSFSISPSNEFSGLISLRIDWLDLLEVQETLKNLFQYHSSKASILRCSAFFIVQLSHPYMTTGKIIALIRWTFVSKVMSLFFNILSRLVIAFLPRSLSFNFMAAITICSDSGAQENKVSHCFHCFPIYLPWSDRTGCHNFSFSMLSFKPAFSLSSFTFIKRLIYIWALQVALEV